MTRCALAPSQGWAAAWRRWLVLALALAGAAAGAQTPMTGTEDADFAGVDAAAVSYLQTYGQPGLSVVVAHGDRIIDAKGYGWADREKRIPTSPWLEYRLASVSKVFTATAVMRLVEQGRVQLDVPAWSYVSAFMAGEPADSRIRQVTVRQLLTHSWGLDRAVSGDWVGGWAQEGGGPPLTSCKDVLRHRLLRMTLDFAPGARYAYNNTGYCWLGFIAETIDGRPLDAQLTALLGPEPLSTGRVRIGEVLPAKYTPLEPRHYDRSGAPLAAPVPGVYPAPAPGQVPRPDGAYTLQGYGGAGGMMASALTVTRFLQRLQGIRQPALLRSDTWDQMRAEQPIADGTRYTGLGLATYLAWQGRPDRWYGFSGRLQGTRTGWYSTPRMPGGPMVTIVALVNGNRAWPADGLADDDIFTELIYPMMGAVDAMGPPRYSAKPEITGERLVAWGSATEAYLADLAFDWGARTYPDLLKGTPQTGTFEGYRYRHFPASGVYVGAKEGRLYLYQPSVNPAIQPLGALTDFLPTVMGTLPLR
jgi:CubicO group peptidase (beta-lactamase class C family)